MEKEIPFEECIVDLGNKPAHFTSMYSSVHPDTLARAKVPILELGSPGAAGYFKLTESGVVTGRGAELRPTSAKAEASARLFVQMFMEQLAGLSFSMMAAGTAEQAAMRLKELLKGMKTVDATLRMYGNEVPFGAQCCG